MAKELPYFRFTASEWLNDDISLESYEVKGLFIDVCSFYWFRDCSIDLALLEKRFSNAKDLLKHIESINILIVNSDNSITIKFLDEQFDLLSEKRKKRSEAGRIGGLSKSSNAKALLKQKPSYKDKDKDKDKDNIIDVFTFDEFWELYADKKDRSKCVSIYAKINQTDRAKIKETLHLFKSHKPFENYTHPNPSTYLRNRRWDDEIKADTKELSVLMSRWDNIDDIEKRRAYSMCLQIPITERTDRQKTLLTKTEYDPNS